MNARERAAMRRDIQKEQNLAIGSVGKTVQSLKADIQEISIAGIFSLLFVSLFCTCSDLFK